MSSTGNIVGVQPTGLAATRWVQLVIGIICMSMIANLQYGWTLFVNPINEKFGWARTDIQIAFTIFVLLETWLVPIEGWFVDKYGPRIVTLFGGLLCGIAWAMNSVAETLFMLYLAAAIGGIGAGAVYGTCVGNALKWFPDRRGLAAGLTAMGFGAGSALTVVPIAEMIKTSGYQSTFLTFGLMQGAIVLVAGFFIAQPEAGYRERLLGAVGRSTLASTRRQYTTLEMARTPTFWVMYVMFVMMAAGGLMATAQLGPIAKDFKVDGVPVSIAGLTLPALTFALSIDRVLNGVTRPFFGWVSDRIGREQTMFLAFGIEAVGIVLLGLYGHHPILFVVLTGLVFFAWGEIYSLFPATCADTYGETNAAANAGLLYTAKGTAALLVPFTSKLSEATGSWSLVFYLAAGMAGLTALMAIVVLRPMRRNQIAASNAS